MNKHIINIKDTGAIGDGITDDSVFIQEALDFGCQTVVIPNGNYRIVTTLKVHSDTFISADNDAHLFVCGESPHYRGEFLLTNSDPINGNENITIKGGIWDGGFGGKYNVKNKDLFDPNANSGACLNFVGVKNLILTDMVIANSVTYYMRFSRIENFVIKNIGFRSEKLSYNQDGLHFGGEVRNGYVENIRAISDGQTNDDMIALNADDSIERLENRDLVRGDIENIYIKDIYAKNCYTAIRMLSVHSAIRNIRIENVYCGCRYYAINMDGARYCATPLFKEDEYPKGSGLIENITVSNMNIYSTEGRFSVRAMILCETMCKDFMITDLKRITEKDFYHDRPTFLARNTVNMKVETEKDDKVTCTILKNKEASIVCDGSFKELYLDTDV